MGMGDIATSGMQAAMSNMDVISNNIANVNTLGFKGSSASFADIFPSGNDASGAQIGLGVQLGGVQQNFKPGTLSSTGLSNNISISNGSGFFVMKDATSGSVTYTRNGNLNFDSVNGYFTVGSQRLQGFAAVNGAIPAGATPTDLKINTSAQPAKATTTLTATGLNLNSGDAIVSVSPFNPANSATYSYSNQSNIYDSLGNAVQLNLYYVKTAANSWNVYAVANGATVLNAGSPGVLTFSNAGALTSATNLSALTYTPATGAAAINFGVTMTGTTQFGNTDSALPFTTDGYPAGTFNKYTIDPDGIVTAFYSAGPSVKVGQVSLAEFASPQNLQYLGGSSWAQTSSSGTASVNPSNSVNSIKQGYLEMSNVDLAGELVNLINAQNTFQANAQVEQVYNQVMQTVTKL